jgi:hypothetical protein
VVTLTTDIINSGQYHLNDDFAKNFLYGYDNGPESIFAIQYSIMTEQLSDVSVNQQALITAWRLNMVVAGFISFSKYGECFSTLLQGSQL